MDEDSLVFDLLSDSFKSKNFDNIITKSSENEVHCRTNIKNKKDLEAWKELYCRETKTSLNVLTTRIPLESQRMLFCQRLICQFASKTHKGVKKHYTGCPFRMKMKIKRSTTRKQKSDKLVATHPCIITINGVHNHSECKETLKELRVLPGVKEEFGGYFKRGMTAPEARRYHQLKMDLGSDISAEQARGDTNPTLRAVSYMFEKWARSTVIGYNDETRFDELRKFAAESDSTIEVEGGTSGSFCAALVTPFMRRVHALREAGEGVFVDSSASVGRFDTTMVLVLLLCSTPAGALPLGAVFASSLDQTHLTKGFRLLQKALGDSAFSGHGHPAVFITDSCDAARSALRAVWPAAGQFLCGLHCLQLAWKWLLDSSNRVLKDQRQKLIQAARRLVNADSPERFQALLDDLKAAHSGFSSYLEAISPQWAIAYPRSQCPHQGHSANSYVAATMWIVKDLVLNRYRARNVCELIMLMDELYNGYMVRRLVDFAYDRRQSKCLAPAAVPETSITRVDEHHFQVVGEQAIYDVELDAGVCSCPQRRRPAGICKHQIACSHVANMTLPQAYVLTPEVRHWLMCLAVGKDRAPDAIFFARLKVRETTSERPSRAIEPIVPSDPDTDRASVRSDEDDSEDVGDCDGERVK